MTRGNTVTETSTSASNTGSITEWRRDGFLLSTDKRRMDVDAVHAYLTRSYWSPGIPKRMVAKAMQHSLCFGLYVDAGPEAGKQIGYARIVSDFSAFAYMADVFVLPAYQGHGLGVWMVDRMVNHPALRDIRSFWLATRDAQGLYARFGFEQLEEPGRFMLARRQMDWYNPELAETGVAAPPAQSAKDA